MAEPKADILIVEDESLVALDIKVMLNDFGYNVAKVVDSGEDALTYLEAIKADLIIMDIVLKGKLSGIETANLIRARYDIPIVFLSAHSDDRTLNKAKKTEPFGYIVKPFKERELHSCLEMALYKHLMERQLRESEERFRRLTESSFEGIILHEKGQILDINPLFASMFEYEPTEIVGKNMVDLFDEESRVMIRKHMDEAYEKPYETIGVKKNNTTFTVELCERPIPYKGRVVRVTSIRDISGRKRTEQELKLSLVKLQSILDGTVMALASTVEKKDPYTAGHQLGTQRIALAISEELGLSLELKNGIKVAAIVHDIGKLSVAAEILSKPIELTEIEMAIIKTHSQVGFEILNTIDFPWPVAKAVLQHHERLNGSGYPQGLSGDEIILEAKIIAVADVVDAIASHRPYRSARGKDAALEEICKNRGVLYDCQVVDACINVFKENRITLD